MPTIANMCTYDTNYFVLITLEYSSNSQNYLFQKNKDLLEYSKKQNYILYTTMEKLQLLIIFNRIFITTSVFSEFYSEKPRKTQNWDYQVGTFTCRRREIKSKRIIKYDLIGSSERG